MRQLFSFLPFLLLISCNIKPQPIEYGVDQCAACKMIISDSRFGCELVTTKGKVFKYDAIECLIPDVLKNGTDHYQYIMVTDFYNPGNFLTSYDARFIIDPDVPSPMGGNLSAYNKSNLDDLNGAMDFVALVSRLSGLERYKVN